MHLSGKMFLTRFVRRKLCQEIQNPRVLLAMLFVATSAFSLDLTRPSPLLRSSGLVQSAKPYGKTSNKLLRRYDKLELDSAIVATR